MIPPSSKFRIERASACADDAALALATRAWPDAEREAYAQGLAATLRAGQDRQILLAAARCGEQLVGAQVGQVLPGNVAVIWPPVMMGVDTSGTDDLVLGLFALLLESAASEGAQSAQALVAVGDFQAQQSLSAGGFHRMAELLYLCAEITSGRPENLELPFDLEPFRVGEEQRLAALVERTYVGTLDCPGLDRWRKTDDVLTGYRAVGQFRPELWSIVRWRDADVGCLLLNVHPDVRHVEIVYLALVPEVRGRSWGRILTAAACETARSLAYERVVLAVDAANEPAKRMYESAGFFEFDRREVWMVRISSTLHK